jgi:hypothetical protein
MGWPFDIEHKLDKILALNEEILELDKKILAAVEALAPKPATAIGNLFGKPKEEPKGEP